jgi:hypothetical protein
MKELVKPGSLMDLVHSNKTDFMLQTAVEVALARIEAREVIPLMTDPLGKYWDQPARSEIELDDTHALMTIGTFRKLKCYSGSRPTGCYPGKMWKRHDGACDWNYIAAGGKPVWLLCWYGLSEKGPDWCSNNSRIILLSNGVLPEKE